MNARTICRSVVLCLSLCGALPATASHLIPRTLPELAAGADLVFVGRCEAVSSHWNEDHTLILTANRFRVTRALKGAPGETVTLDELGGVVGGIGMDVADVPRFSVGEEALLFVRRTELGRWETFGAGQGRFRLTRDAQGRPWVQNDFYRAELAAMTPPGWQVGAGVRPGVGVPTRTRPADTGARAGSGAPLAVFATRLQAAARTEGRPR
jgi:hypothetical protein